VHHRHHFRFARAAAAYKIQHLGNEAGLPTLADIEALRHEFEDVRHDHL
jgi:sugar/nucleoside kinase (ribokinase family)